MRALLPENKMSTPNAGRWQSAILITLRRLWLAAGALVAFALIAWQVQTDGPLVQVDLWLQQAPQAWRTPAMVALASGCTLLGNTTWVGGLAVLCSLLLAGRRYWLPLAGLWTTMIGAGLSVVVLKGLIYRPRPAGLDGIVIETSSFPSGNSILAAALFGAVMLLVLPQFLAGRPLRIAACLVALLPLLVAASRLVLSVHYLSDTLAGLCMGTAWAIVGSLFAVRR